MRKRPTYRENDENPGETSGSFGEDDRSPQKGSDEMVYVRGYVAGANMVELLDDRYELDTNRVNHGNRKCVTAFRQHVM